MIAALVLAVLAGARGDADAAAHARAQRAARIARVHTAWEEAAAKPRELASALLARGGDAWPSDAELDAAAALLLGRAEPATSSEGALQQLADALDLHAVPGWVEGVSASGAEGAFQLVVERGRDAASDAALDAGLTLRVVAPRERRVLAERKLTAAALAHVELDARVPLGTEYAVELAVELERTAGERAERAMSRRIVLPRVPGLGQRIAALPRETSRELPRVDVARAVEALELLGAAGRQTGLTRDPLPLLGALELNEVIATQAAIEHHGRGGLRLCGPLSLVASSTQQWIGWQAGPGLERIVWFWSSPDQPYDALFVGSDVLALEWQRIASGRGWLLVGNEPREARDAAACLAELRAAFPGTPVTLVARGAVGLPAVAADELVCVARSAPPPATVPLLWVAAGAAAAQPGELLPAGVTRVDGPACAFLADPRLPRELDAWREARRPR